MGTTWVIFCSEHQEVWWLGHEISTTQILIDSMKLLFKVLCQYILLYSCEWESHLSIHLPILILSYFNLQTWWVRNGIWFLFYFSFPWLLIELSLFLLFVGCSDSSSGNVLFIAFGHFSLRLIIFFILFCGNLAYSFFSLLRPLGRGKSNIGTSSKFQSSVMNQSYIHFLAFLSLNWREVSHKREKRKSLV